MTEVLVIGAGPAGLAAAAAAQARGAQVILLDAADQVGGQYWRHLPGSRPAERERILHHGWERFTTLRRAVIASCEVVTGAQVWAIETPRQGPPVVHALVGPADGTNRSPRTFRPDAIVLATGAHDRTLPFPGWDLPGVFTGGAAQAFAKSERVAVGHRVIVAGAGPFLLPVAASLTQTGATVVGIVEASGGRNLARGWLAQPWRLLGTATKGSELLGYVANGVRHRIGYHPGQAVVAAYGTDQVEAVTVADVDADWRPVPGTQRRIEVDAVCVSHGFTPRLELAIAADCAISAERFVVVGDEQETTTPDVYAAGEITGIGGADLALAEGSIAGHVAAGGTSSDIPGAVRRRRSYRRFAARLEAAHGIRPGWTGWLTDDTVLCRCEEVDYGTLRTTAELSATTGLRSLRLSTRAGLGVCQGRICGRTVEELLAGLRVAGQPCAESVDGASTDRRPIAAPVRLDELAQVIFELDPLDQVLRPNQEHRKDPG